MESNISNQESRYLIGVSVITFLIVLTAWIHTMNQPLLDLFSFRQCQTAMSSLWMNLGEGWEAIWSYKTPEFGVPWSIPFEFPLYQYIVKVTCATLHTTLDPTGRTINCLFFLGSILLAMRFLKQIGLPREVAWTFFILSICSPLYIYWSRTFMIESCAVFFGFLMLVTLQRYLQGKNYFWLGVVMLSSILCALVKVTTWPSFVFIAFSLKFLSDWDKKCFNKNIISVNISLLLAILMALPLVVIWTHHADAIKAANMISSFLTSKSLSAWNYGTLAQRCSYHLWIDVLCKRAIPHIFGSFWFILCIIFGVLFSDPRTRHLLLIFIAGFLLPVLLFTNLHIIHTYYQYANGFWLLIALAISVFMISKRLPSFGLLILIIGIGCIELHTCYGVYWPEMINSHENDDALLAAKIIESNTPKDASVLIIGDDWSPEVGYYSKRRSIYFPNWLTPDQIHNAFSNLSNLSGKYPIKSIVFRKNNQSSQKLLDSSNDIELWAINEGNKYRCGNYEIYFLQGKEK